MDPEGPANLAKMINTISSQSSHRRNAMVRLVTKMVQQYQPTSGSAPEMHSVHVRHQEFLARLRDCLIDLNEYVLPALVIDVKLHRRFRYRDLSEINRVMEEIGSADDCDYARDYLVEHLGLSLCEGCDQYEYDDEMQTTYEDDVRCRNCIENNYRWSDYYEQYVYYESTREALDRNGNYVIVSEDDDDFDYDDDRDCYVHNDYVPPAPPIIGNYHSSKSRQVVIKDDWSVANHRWFGVELEVEVRDADRADKARHLNELINGGQIGSKVFFENDGSLNSGFEIISQPMSLPAHQDLWRWLQNNDAIRGLRSHNTTTCGLHVHVNRDGLSGIQLARMVTFINDPTNEQLIRAIARRYSEGYCKIKNKTIDNALENIDRYEALNVTNHKTVEFRIFKGSLKYDSVLSAIEFANALTMFCNRYTKAEDLSTPNFLSFINDDIIKETSTLRPYIQARLELN